MTHARSPLLWGALFLLSRVGVSVAFGHRASWDVYYYWFHIDQARGGAVPLGEYPTPVVWLLQGIHLVAPTQSAFTATFVALLIATDAVLAVALRRRDWAAGAWWITFGALVGVVGYYRLDLFTAAAVAGACLLLVSHPRASGALLGLGAALKLWPALLIAPFAARSRTRAWSFALVGGGLGLASLWFAGWERSVSPLIWQRDRGLQIESIAATPLLLAKALVGESWVVSLTTYNAWEITGPGVGIALSLTTIGTAATLAVALVLAWRLYRTPGTVGALWAALSLTCLLIVTNKTFSPQYVWWLAGPLAVLVTLRALSPRLTGLALVVAGLTQYVFPWGYDGIVTGQLGPVLALVVRNVTLVCLTGAALLASWRATTPDFRVASSHQA